MLFNEDPKYTEDLHTRLLQALNGPGTKKVLSRFCCMGHTSADGNLLIYISKNKKKHLCNPLYETLLYFRCLFSDKEVRKNPDLTELLYTFISPTLPLRHLTVTGYFLTNPCHGVSLHNRLEDLNIKPTGYNPVTLTNLHCTGRFILCRPLYAGAIVKCKTPFNEEKALRTLGGLRNAIFIDTKYIIPKPVNQVVPNVYDNVTKESEAHTTQGTLESVNPPLPIENIYETIQDVLEHVNQSLLEKRIYENIPHKQELAASQPLPIQAITQYSNQHDTDTTSKHSTNTKGPSKPKWLTKAYLKKRFAHIIYDTQHSTVDNTGREPVSQSLLDERTYENIPQKQEPVSQSLLDESIYENILQRQEPASQPLLDESIYYETIEDILEPASQPLLDESIYYETIEDILKPVSQSLLDERIYETIEDILEPVSQPLPKENTCSIDDTGTEEKHTTTGIVEPASQPLQKESTGSDDTGIEDDTTTGILEPVSQPLSVQTSNTKYIEQQGTVGDKPAVHPSCLLKIDGEGGATGPHITVVHKNDYGVSTTLLDIILTKQSALNINIQN